MSKEKQTDNNSWQNRLQNLDDLQDHDAVFDKQQAWDKLDARLHKKEDRKKIGWYWAAACLLLLLAVPIVIKFMHTAPIHNMAIKKTVNPHPVAPVVATDNNGPAIIVSPPMVKKAAEHTLLNNKRSFHKIELQKNNDAARNEVTAVAQNPLPENTQTAPLTIVTDTTSAIAKVAMVPAKKKLPVVHINELDKHDLDNAQFATRTQWPAFQVRFINQDNNNATALPASNPKQDILKLQIPLKN